MGHLINADVSAHRRARSCSLLVATALLILALLDEGTAFQEKAPHIVQPNKGETQLSYYLTGQVIAAYPQVRLWPTHQLIGVPARRSPCLHLLASQRLGWSAQVINGDVSARRRGKMSLLIRRDATLRIACLNGR